MRGLSLWIAHMAGDEYARSVGSDDQAESWLGDTVGRQEQAFWPSAPEVRLGHRSALKNSVRPRPCSPVRWSG